jgi:sigma-B regulation protein RsbU (phosphoserine phosphatase)
MSTEPVSDHAHAGLEEDVRRLRRAVRELSILNDLAREIGASVNSQHIMSTIISRSVRSVRAEQGVITLVDRASDRDMRTLVRRITGPRAERTLHVEESLVGWMQLNRSPIVVNHPREDPRFRGVRWDESLRSLLCVPLLVKSELAGVLTVFNKVGPGGFTEDDQRLLSIVAGQSAQVVENARLYEEGEALRRMQEELRLASEIQLGLLPKSAPLLPGYDVAGGSIPAEAVGGDYFDFIRIDEDRWAICVGDVTGKGLSAALLMANLQATIRAQALLGLPPCRCLENANALLAQSTEPHKFATCFYALLDTRSHEIRYSSAGHDPPLLLSDGKATACVEAGGLVLGFLESVEYDEAVVRMRPGDALVVYSDGITETVNERDEPFGVERLGWVLRDNLEEPAQALLQRIVDATVEHSGRRGRQDDMTLIVIKRDRT